MQQKLNRELEQYARLLQEQRLDIVSKTLAHLEKIGDKFPAFIGWVIGTVNVDGLGRIEFDSPLNTAPHSAFIQLWMIGWQAKHGHLWLRHIAELDLRGLGIIEFPNTMKYLTRVKRLRLEGNPVYSLYSGIEWVSIDQNQIHRFAWICKRMEQPPEIAVDFSEYLGDESIIWSSLQDLCNVVSIHLRNPAVQEVPSWIRKVSSLRELQLAGCRIREIPKWIEELVHLQILNIGDQRHNDKIVLPESMGNLINLRSLGLSGMGLSSLPDCLSSLVRLKVLYLDTNQLDSLPLWMEKLQELQVLWLTGNPLKEFPRVLSLFPQLKQVALHLMADNTGYSQHNIALELKRCVPHIKIIRYRMKFWRRQNRLLVEWG